jgi:hypothetical protein
MTMMAGDDKKLMIQIRAVDIIKKNMDIVFVEQTNTPTKNV